MGADGNSELSEFLRTRRAKITPARAGLPAPAGTRRVPGLRREEVALIVGVSVDYYVRLERGSNGSVSDSVLEAVARALQLDDTEREHLFALARPARTRPRALKPQRVRPGLQRLLDSVSDVPALVLGHRIDVLASNHLARAFYTDFEALPPRERNMARFTFLDESARDFYVDWVGAARGIVATLHLYAGTHPNDPRLAELVGELSVRDPDFRRWWAEHDVFHRTHGAKHYRHPLVGELTLGYEAFHPTDDPDQTLGLHTAEAGSRSEQALRLLASWTTDPSGSPAATRSTP
jgi:transcriptional regulator with XRE-family HTH domain